MHDWWVSINGHQEFVALRLIFVKKRIAVCLGRGSMERKSGQKYKSCGALEARGAGRGEVWYGMIWLRNLRSKLFKSFCSTYLEKE